MVTTKSELEFQEKIDRCVEWLFLALARDHEIEEPIEGVLTIEGTARLRTGRAIHLQMWANVE
jgi:hypothetical protein